MIQDFDEIPGSLQQLVMVGGERFYDERWKKVGG
jgi:hypothetical protein